MRPIGLPLALLALASLAAPSSAQSVLTRTGGVLPGLVTYNLQGDPLDLYVMIPSLSAGPFPLFLVDPLDPRVLEVGSDLQSLWKVGLLGATGAATVIYPLPNVPVLQGFPLNGQFITVPGSVFLVDDVSTPTHFRMAFEGTSTSALSDEPNLRDAHGATVLDDGRVLLSGGLSEDGIGNPIARDDFTLFDPQTQAFSAATGQLSAGRAQFKAIKLDDGRVMIIGGADETETAHASCEIWNPSTGQTSGAASMSVARVVHTATKLSDGRVFVAGGASQFSSADLIGSLSSLLSSTEIYDPVADSWSNGPSLQMTRAGHAASLTGDGKVLITGGIEVQVVFGAPIPSISNDCRLYDPVTNTLQNVSDFSGDRALHAQVTLDNGDVLITGGAQADFLALTATPLASSRVYNSASDSWTNVGDMATARGFHQLINVGGEVVVIGGLSSVDAATFTGTAAQEIEKSAQTLISWASAGSTNDPRPVAISVAIEGGERILTTGSIDAIGGNDLSAEIYVP